MNPSLIVAAFARGAAGFAVAPLVQTATTASEATSASSPASRVFDMCTPFHLRWTSVPHPSSLRTRRLRVAEWLRAEPAGRRSSPPSIGTSYDQRHDLLVGLR